ncbi:MAG: glycine cleavage system protein GcvH [Candidatus Dormibacteria bacterium]
MTELSSFRFTATHEWVHMEDGQATIGITDHAQSQLGDVIFVELPDVGTTLRAGEKFGAIESVKAASDLYAPVAGTVAEVNPALQEQPEPVNNEP